MMNQYKYKGGITTVPTLPTVSVLGGSTKYTIHSTDFNDFTKKWQTDYLAPLCSSQTLLARARLAGWIVNLFTFFNFSLQT